MTIRTKSLLWALVIIVAALISVSLGLSDNASFGITAGLTSAAGASLFNGRSCLQ